jgi:hypothetical protein
MSLTTRVASSVVNPATDDGFDPHAQLADLLDGIGTSLADTGGSIRFDGADPIVPPRSRTSSPRCGHSASLNTSSPRCSLTIPAGISNHANSPTDGKG